MTGKTELIKKTVLEIEMDKDFGKSIEYLKDKYADFLVNCPELFKIIVESKNRLEYRPTLNRMLEASFLVENGHTDLEDMDKLVGQELAKEYIYPIIDMEKEFGDKN